MRRLQSTMGDYKVSGSACQGGEESRRDALPQSGARDAEDEAVTLPSVRTCCPRLLGGACSKPVGDDATAGAAAAVCKREQSMCAMFGQLFRGHGESTTECTAVRNSSLSLSQQARQQEKKQHDLHHTSEEKKRPSNDCSCMDANSVTRLAWRNVGEFESHRLERSRLLEHFSDSFVDRNHGERALSFPQPTLQAG